MRCVTKVRNITNVERITKVWCAPVSSRKWDASRFCDGFTPMDIQTKGLYVWHHSVETGTHETPTHCKPPTEGPCSGLRPLKRTVGRLIHYTPERYGRTPTYASKCLIRRVSHERGKSEPIPCSIATDGR